MIPKCCTIIPVHPPKFGYALKFLETFYQYNTADHTVYFVFSNEYELDQFKILTSLSFKGLILPENLRGYKSIVNVKKYYALNELKDKYSYLGVYDSETEIVKEVDLNLLYQTIYENKIFKCNRSTFEHFHHPNYTEYLISKLGITPNDEIRSAIDSNFYWWFNEIPVYESKSFKRFYNWFISLPNLDDIRNDYWCFDYLLYSIWLIINDDFKFKFHDVTRIWGAIEEFRVGTQEKDKITDMFKSYWDTNAVNHREFPHIKLLFHTDVNPPQ